ncbi:helix-turn-helix domain-containing protein [Curvibacter sp. HBC61]|uniref:Helix-turn-helix domain-containing protein n=1 Tax=Curvibacter cyanobacteriorum TaxID=3026422 RepID=A0ABT5N336_9BURK|nr:helix-turn-helix domain-containing protein [Curvibacter sp. HBC61]MDD0840497.1 helix-turn-helix domain-containing protein [Curvibacter sp. HBC61]
MAAPPRLNAPPRVPDGGPLLAAAAPRIAVHFVLLPDSLILDWAGPAEALRIANQARLAQGLPAVFELHFVGPSPHTRSSVGAHISGLAPLPELGPRGATAEAAQAAAVADAHPSQPSPGVDCDWVVVVGQPGRTVALDHPEGRAVLHWLRGLRLQAGRLELLCVCAGAVIAAHAGLLSGHRVTTHHQHLDELRAADPACEVVQNRVFVLDNPVSTSAGVTTGIDLFLHRIAQHCGPALAAQVAQTLVMGWRRGPQAPELSPFLHHRDHLHPALHRVQDAVSQEPQRDWSVPRMAEVAHTSARHLGRLFTEHAGIAPLDYVRQLRLAVAETALQAGLNVTQAAAMAGFSSDTQLRRTWRDLGRAGAPSQWTRRAAPH